MPLAELGSDSIIDSCCMEVALKSRCGLRSIVVYGEREPVQTDPCVITVLCAKRARKSPRAQESSLCRLNRVWNLRPTSHPVTRMWLRFVQQLLQFRPPCLVLVPSVFDLFEFPSFRVFASGIEWYSSGSVRSLRCVFFAST
eukprot:4850460-Amphidinium_carterae.2